MPKIRSNYLKHTNGYIIVNGHVCVAGDDIEVDHTVDCYAENQLDYLSDVFYSRCSPELQQLTPKDLKDTENKLECFKEGLTQGEKRNSESDESRALEISWTSTSTQFTDTNKSDHVSDSPYSCYFSGSETSETSPFNPSNEREVPEGNRKRKLSDDNRELMEANEDLPSENTNDDFRKAMAFIQDLDLHDSLDLEQFKKIKDVIATKELELKTKEKRTKQKAELSPVPVNQIGAARQQLQNLLMLVKSLSKMKLIHELPYISHMETLLDLSECYQTTYNINENRLPNHSLLPQYLNNETTLKPLQKNTYNTYDVKIVVEDYFAKKTTRC